jgi:hypothetical protein
MAASLRHLGTRTCVRSPNNMAFVAIKMDRRQGALEQFCFESQLIDPAAAGPKSCDLPDRILFY